MTTAVVPAASGTTNAPETVTPGGEVQPDRLWVEPEIAGGI
jgi:hypothetical protein